MSEHKRAQVNSPSLMVETDVGELTLLEPSDGDSVHGARATQARHAAFTPNPAVARTPLRAHGKGGVQPVRMAAAPSGAVRALPTPVGYSAADAATQAPGVGYPALPRRAPTQPAPRQAPIHNPAAPPPMPSHSAGHSANHSDRPAPVSGSLLTPTPAPASSPGSQPGSHPGSRPGSRTGPTASSHPGLAASALPTPGTRVGHYELIRELGRGGMGAVFLARDTKLGRRVAIKFLHSGGQAELTQRFILEARVTAQVSHENIVVIHEVEEYEGNPYMVLEYLQGEPLTALMSEGKRIPPGRAVELMVPVVRALIRAHAHEIVHRDLKPDNIFLTESGTVKVLDFGIAKLVQQHQSREKERRGRGGLAARIAAAEDGHTELTRQGALVGTIPYMSPEQWMGMGVDHRSDVWAVGILLYKMLAGRHPLAPLKGHQLMVTAMLDQPMPSLREACPDVGENLIRVVDRCLRKPIGERYASAKDLLEALEPLLPGRYTRSLRIDESPYAGLSAFQESDANRFFGRNREIAALVTRMRDQPLIGVVGPSGVGKSSFVRAGVVPALKHSGESWKTIVIRPGRNPMAALADVAASVVGTSTTGVSSTTVADDISEQQGFMQRLRDEPGFLGTVLRSRARKSGQKILLFIDQFEELYTLIPDLEERRAFTECLSGVADDATTPLRVVLSIRSDFLDRVTEDERFMAELSQGLFFLMPPNRDSLREAITMPAEMAGYRFEVDGMVDHMIDTLASTAGALPLLQFTATKLWDARDENRKLLTESSYIAMGGTEGALASHADAVLSELTGPAQNLVRAIFLRLVTPDRTRAIVSIRELLDLTDNPGEVQRTIDHLVHARLLVVQSNDAQVGASVEIVHESLLNTWPRLRQWLDENQDDAAILDQLRTAARQWDANGRPGGLVWRGEAAEEARRFQRRYRGTLSRLEEEYLQAVFRIGRRAKVIRTTALAAVMIALVAVAGGSTVAMIRISQAESEAQQQAKAAIAAEQAVRDQNKNLKQAIEQQKAAEREAKEASDRLQAANSKLTDSQDELLRSYEGLEDALKRAERAKRKARRERRRAKRAAAVAMQNAMDARVARDRAERLVEAEQERLRQLQARLTGDQSDGSGLLEDLE